MPRNLLPTVLAAIAIFGIKPVVGAESNHGAAPPPQSFAEKVQPLFEKYCFDCHSGEDPDGAMRLDEFRSADAVSQARKSWERILHMMRRREMPPKDAERPPEEDLNAAITWIDAKLNDIDCTGPVDPGRVTIRRLNRVEYGNTIRDLLGVDFEAAAEFPADDVGYGFDNIGDVLSLPPMLMEKYLAAAEEISRRAILTDPLQAAGAAKFDGGQMSTGRWFARRQNGPAVLPSQGELYVDHAFPSDGEFLIRVLAAGDQAGDEPVKMALKIDKEQVELFEVKVERGNPQNYDHQFTTKKGKHRVAVAFTNDFYEPDHPDPNRRDRNLHVMRLEIVGPLGIGPDDYPQSHRRIFFVQPGDQVTPESAARQIVERLATRAFRRPVREEELARLLRLASQVREDGESFETSIQYALQAILVSPHFLFRIEQDPEPNTRDNIREIDEYELATRLSYFLWSSMPDQELFEMASRGELRKNLDSQVARMLADPKSSALVDNFALQWLQLRNLTDFVPDRGLFPAFDDELREAMVAETRAFCEHIMREDRSVIELIDADYTFVNEPLAKHYGISGVTGGDFRRVSLDGTPRGGVITQASVLAVTSNPTRTSPVKRGKWILENILGTPPPEPPANVPQLSEDRRAALTASLRERLEEHRRNPNCAVCHRKMDAMGFAMENFDAVGAWRTHDGKFKIDPSGELPDGSRFDGPDALKIILRSDPYKGEFAKCLTEKMLTYAVGRGLERYDKCAVDKITKSLSENGYRFSILVLQISRSDPFQKRRGKDDDG